MNVISPSAFSIIIPTYEEAANISREIVKRISEVSFDALFCEIIIVDDDEAKMVRVEVVNALLSEYSFFYVLLFWKDKKVWMQIK